MRKKIDFLEIFENLQLKFLLQVDKMDTLASTYRFSASYLKTVYQTLDEILRSLQTQMKSHMKI